MILVKGEKYKLSDWLNSSAVQVRVMPSEKYMFRVAIFTNPAEESHCKTHIYEVRDHKNVRQIKEQGKEKVVPMTYRRNEEA